MKNVDWYYQRKGCKTCAKTDAFLTQHQLKVSQLVDCKKQPMGKDDLQPLLSQVNQVLAVRGSAVKRYQTPFDQSEVLGAVLGPTGNLRAPSLRQGQTLYVGYDSELYSGLLNS